MKTLRRFFRHLTTTTAEARRAFPPATLKAIENAIAEGETRHRAEVRLVIEPALGMSDILNELTPRQRARELFAHLGVWDTDENCGVLVYIQLADHQVEIVADRGVGRVVAAKEWQAICRTMTGGFAQGTYHDSVLEALAQLNTLLQRHYPDDGSVVNQLSNRPIIV